MNKSAMLSTAASAALAVCFAAGTADARMLSGYGAFHPWPSKASQSCMQESWGGVINRCGSTQSTVIFELPVDADGSKTVTAVAYGNGSGAITCQAVALNSTAESAFFGAQKTFNPSGITSLSFTTTTGAGDGLRLQCINVPANRGILSLNWTRGG